MKTIPEPAPSTPVPVSFERFVLDAECHEFRRDGEIVEIAPRVFDTLVYLVANRDRVVPKSELLDTVWRGTLVTDNVLAQAISALRRVLEDDARSPRFIKSLPRIGYRFVGDVQAAGRSDGAHHPRLAVLPFTALDDGAGDDALRSGIADDLVSRLSRLKKLIVRPLASARMAIDEADDAVAVGRFLDVDWVLTGQVGRRGENLRVTFQITSVDSAEILMTETFDRAVAEIFAVQEAICDRVLERLPVQSVEESPVSGSTTVPAYAAFLEGRLFLARFTQHDVERAVTLFEQSLDHDPAYAPAWGSLAECHDFFGTVGADTGRHFRAASRASTRALALDRRLPEAHCMQAKVAWQYDWDWQRAEEVFARTVAAFPYRADVLIAYSDFCCFMKARDKSVALAQRALEIDPVSPWINTLLAQALHMAGRHDAAAVQAARALDLAPGFPFAHFFLGLANLALGDYAKALADFESAVVSGRPDFVAGYAAALAIAGETARAEAILDEIVALGDAVPPIGPALIRLALGMHEAAAAGFEECIRRRDWHVLLLHAEPVVEPLTAGTTIPRIIEELQLPAAS